jgi:hypothetical protein
MSAERTVITVDTQESRITLKKNRKRKHKNKDNDIDAKVKAESGAVQARKKRMTATRRTNVTKFLGAHVSIAGGIHNAVNNSLQIGYLENSS